jgi:hypothetical protein
MLNLSSQFWVPWADDSVHEVLAHFLMERQSMAQARIRIDAMLCSLLSVVWLTSGLVWANEAFSVKPEPELVPASPKPHGTANEPKLIGKGYPSSRTGAVPKPASAPRSPRPRSPARTGRPWC